MNVNNGKRNAGPTKAHVKTTKNSTKDQAKILQNFPYLKKEARRLTLSQTTTEFSLILVGIPRLTLTTT